MLEQVSGWLPAIGALVGVAMVGVTLLVLLGVGLLVWRVFGGLSRAKAERERLLREGVPAPATVVSLAMGNMTMRVGVHRHLQLQLLVEVQPPGRAPWQAPLVTMVSELQIPQIQPGTGIQVRYDPADPSRLALEGFGGPAGAPAAMPGPGPLPAVVSSPAPYTPAAAPGFPRVAKIGLAIGLLGVLLGVGAATAAVAVSVFGFGSSSGEGDGVCDEAVRCCQVVSDGQPGAAQGCANLGRFGVPDRVCSEALQGFERAAASRDLVCE